MIGPRRSVAMAVLGLAAVACSSNEPEASPVGAEPGDGRLALIDDLGDVVVIDPDGGNRIVVGESEGAIGNWQPSWSPDGRSLAWGQTSSEGFAMIVHSEGRTTRIPMPALPFYSMWSPTGDRIAALRSATGGGLELEFIDVDDGTTRVVASGAPYYFSWSPDGDQIFSHVAVTTLAVVGDEGSTPIGGTDSDFQAPVWTDDGLVHVDEGRLVRRSEPEAVPEVLAGLPGPVTFVASPSGDRLAVQSLIPLDEGVFASFQQVPEIPANRVVVLDRTTGELTVASSDPSFAYFWSPDGSSLLMLVANSEEAEVVWRVWTPDGGGADVGAGFVPIQPFVRDIVPFFDQYAQSWNAWAPDSSAFAFVGRIDGVEGVWVQELDESEPELVSDGTWVAWSAG